MAPSFDASPPIPDCALPMAEFNPLVSAVKMVLSSATLRLPRVFCGVLCEAFPHQQPRPVNDKLTVRTELDALGPACPVSAC
jgi:hypothetical protein